MDPITQAFVVTGKALDFGMLIWQATPEPLKAQSAGDWAKFVHNISDVILNLQDKINAAVVK